MPHYTHRPTQDRGAFAIDWLKARYSFSFGQYFDPDWMGFRGLRVINQDRVRGGGGFGEHGHEHMEILTYVINGQLEHRDSTGGHEIMHHGRIQVMSAGTGIRHAELNATPDTECHLLQCWLLPNNTNVSPNYRMGDFPVTNPSNQLQLLASGKSDATALPINADAQVWAGTLAAGTSYEHALNIWPHAWLQIVAGSASVDGHTLHAGDGLGVENASSLHVAIGESDCELMLFELA